MADLVCMSSTTLTLNNHTTITEFTSILPDADNRNFYSAKTMIGRLMFAIHL